MKIGDRVRYNHAGGLGYAGHDGRTGTVTSEPKNGHTHVTWDDGRKNPSNPFLKNLERINMIDITKPLELSTGDEVTFITMTSPDNHIMVGAGAHWVIYDRNGKWVRSKIGQGSLTTLRNKLPVVRVEYRRPDPLGGLSFKILSELVEGTLDATARIALKYTYEDEKLVDVEVIKF